MSKRRSPERLGWVPGGGARFSACCGGPAFLVFSRPASRPVARSWGHSSAGRALQWHCRGHRFDPGWLHQYIQEFSRYRLNSCTLGEAGGKHEGLNSVPRPVRYPAIFLRVQPVASPSAGNRLLLSFDDGPSHQELHALSEIWRAPDQEPSRGPRGYEPIARTGDARCGDRRYGRG